ncbi:MAG: efflux RND transporter periplasmic adaptor subunit, partial [Aeromicrobium sp.]
ATGLFSGGDGGADAPAASAIEPAVPAVQVVDLVAEVHERRLVLFGRTKAQRKVQVRAETGGQVLEKVVEKGQTVKAGDVLIRLGMEDRSVRRREAEALVEQWQAKAQASASLARSGYAAALQSAEDKATLEAARARLEAIRLEISRTEIRAPFDGVVDDVNVEVGDYVEAYDQVALVVDLDPIKIVAQVTERDADGIRIDREAAVRLVNGTTAHGAISYVARTGDPATRTFRVDVTAANGDAGIAEGITAEVVLPVGQALAHLVSPAILTLDDSGAVGVKIVDDQGRVRFLPIEIVDDTSEGMWISGLPERSRVIIVGQEFVRDGQQVRPVATAARTPGLKGGS